MPTKKLTEVCDIVYGFAFKANEFNEAGKGLPVIRIGDVDQNKTDKFFDGKYDEKYLINRGDILLGLSGSFKANRWQGEKALLNQRVATLRNFENKIAESFIFYQLPRLLQNLERLITQLSVKNILTKHLDNLEVLYLLLKIQKQIVERMDKIAEAQKLNDELIKKSDELFQSLLHKEFDQTNKDWRVKKLPEVAKIQRGKFTPRPRNDPKYFSGDIPWIQTGDITNSDGTIYNYSQTLNEEGLKVSRIFPKGTIVITIAANIGDLAILGIDAAFPDSIVGITTDESIINNKFLYFQMLLQKDYLNKQAPQAAQKNINLQILSKINIYLPSINEQKQIVAKLSAVREYKKQLLEQKLKLKELFDSVLHRSISSRQVNR